MTVFYFYLLFSIYWMVGIWVWVWDQTGRQDFKLSAVPVALFAGLFMPIVAGIVLVENWNPTLIKKREPRAEKSVPDYQDENH